MMGEDGHLAPRDELEQQRAHTGGEQGNIAVESCQQGDKHQRAESHEKHLRAQQAVTQTQPVTAGIELPASGVELFRHAVSYLVPKMRSPASPRPGMM